MKKRAALLGKQILEAVDYYSPLRIVKEFTEVTGHKAKFTSIDAEDYMKPLPGKVAQELLETNQLMENPGYYAGASLDESLRIVEQKPKTWKEYVAQQSQWK